MKRNLTIQLDEEIIKQVKAIAARRGTSVSGLVAAHLHQLAHEDDDYERARKRALELMDQAVDRGGITWNREEIYEERLSRHGR